MKTNHLSNPVIRTKTLLFILLGILSASLAFAQTHEAVIGKAAVTPVVDGMVDQAWAQAAPNNIALPYRQETPTLGTAGQTWWKGLWTMEGLYFLVNVTDDVFSPAYAGESYTMNWMYDKVELYIDANYIQKDAMGPAHGKGHYCYAPVITESMVNTGFPGNIMPNGSTYCYKITDQSYVAEFFIPFSELTDKESYALDKTSPFGFDVTVIDTDVKSPVRNRMVWANSGRIDESWNNMDDAGQIVLESGPFIELTLIKKITLTPGSISTDMGTLQMLPVLEPATASSGRIQWSVINGTGNASISNTGLVTALCNGTVTIKAVSKDDPTIEASTIITISGQTGGVNDPWRVHNLIRNWDFNDGMTNWNYWSDVVTESPVIENGVVKVTSFTAPDGNYWHYQFNQWNLDAMPNVPYVLKFKSWSSVPKSNRVLFEDTSENSYNRYGASTDAEAINGRSEWQYNTTTEPRWYTFHVVFDQIKPTTTQKLQWMLSNANATTYLDSVLLMREDGLGNPAFLSVSINRITLSSARASTGVFTVTSNTSWNASVEQPWLTLNPSAATGDQDVSFTVLDNPGETKREALITVSASGTSPKTLLIIQPGQPQTTKILSVTPGSLSSLLTAEELANTVALKLTGSMDARDFKVLRDQMPLLRELDMGEATIVSYSGMEGTSGTLYHTYPANGIPDNAFRIPLGLGKNTLKNIILPASLTSIGNEAFTFCNGITSITIPEGVNTIKPYAFSSCGALTTINIPSTLTSIGAYAFQNCSALTSLTIPASVTSIGEFAFNNCAAVITAETGNPNYSSQEGVLYNKDKTSLISCPISKAGKLVIPSSVRAIENSAFGFCSKITSINIPESVISISHYAFSQCTGLDSVYVFSSVPVNLSVSTDVFYGVFNKTAFLFVPQGSKASYAAAAQWKGFTFIIEMSDFSLSTTTLELKAEGGDPSSVYLYCDSTWIATCDQPWLTVTPQTGTGSGVLSITARQNTTEKLRIAHVLVTAEGKTSKIIEVTQKTNSQTIPMPGSPTYGENWGYAVWNSQNLIKNWNFNDNLTHWGFWVDGAGTGPTNPVIENGIVSMTSRTALDGNYWHYQFNQWNLDAMPNVPYVLKFKSWSSVPKSNRVLFEDTPENSYNRYGASADAEAINGRSEWQYNTTTEPRWYTFHVVFDQIKPSTTQKLQWMLSIADATTYLDSVILIKEGDSISVNDPYLILSKNSIFLDDKVANATFTISSNTNWEIHSDQGWLYADRYQGTGNQTITLTALDNIWYTNRTATITVDVMGQAAQTISVIQKARQAAPVEPGDDDPAEYWSSEAWNNYNLIKNWNFSSDLTNWDYWVYGTLQGQSFPTVTDGILSMNTATSTDGSSWHYLVMQRGLQAEPNVPYTLKFKSWSSVPRSNVVIFEDTYLNNYNRYGASTDAESMNGRSEWIYFSSPEPTWHTFHVVFDQMTSSTEKKIQWMLSTARATSYLDSIILIKDSDLLKVKKAQLALSANHIDVNYTEAQATVDVSSNTNSLAISDQDWLTVYPSLVTGNKTIAIAAQPNPTNQVRTATVTLYPAGLPSQTITVTQDFITGTKVISADQKLKVFPNPTTGKVNVVMDQAPPKGTYLSVHDLTGKLILKQPVESSEQWIDLEGNPPGVYFILINLKDYHVQKVILK